MPPNITITTQSFLILSVVLVLVLTGAFLRFNGLIETAAFDSDMSRDVLAVDHLVRWGEHHLAVPFAAGGFVDDNMYLSNSFLYYYLLVPFYLIGQTPEWLLYSINILAVCNVLIFFYLGNKLGGSWAGLVCAIYFALHISFVYATRDIWQPFFLAALLPLMFLCLFQAWSTKSKYAYLLSIYLFGLAAHLHFSMLALGVPLLAYFIEMSLYFYKQNRKVFWLGIFAVLQMILLLFIGSFQFTHYELIPDFLYQILQKDGDSSVIWSLSNFDQQYRFARLVPWSVWFLPALATLGGLQLLRKFQKSAEKNQQLKLLGFFLLTFISYVAARLIFEPKIHYFLPFQFLFVLWIGYAVSSFSSWIAKGVICVALSLFCLVSSQEKLATIAFGNEMYQKRVISERIFEHLSADEKANFELTAIVSWHDSWDVSAAHAYWYYLEHLFDRQMVKLEKLNANTQLIGVPQRQILICERKYRALDDPKPCLAVAEQYFAARSTDKSSENTQIVEIPKNTDGYDYPSYRLFEVKQ